MNYLRSVCDTIKNFNNIELGYKFIFLICVVSLIPTLAVNEWNLNMINITKLTVEQNQYWRLLTSFLGSSVRLIIRGIDKFSVFAIFFYIFYLWTLRITMA